VIQRQNVKDDFTRHTEIASMFLKVLVPHQPGPQPAEIFGGVK